MVVTFSFTGLILYNQLPVPIWLQFQKTTSNQVTITVTQKVTSHCPPLLYAGGTAEY